MSLDNDRFPQYGHQTRSYQAYGGDIQTGGWQVGSIFQCLRLSWISPGKSNPGRGTEVHPVFSLLLGWMQGKGQQGGPHSSQSIFAPASIATAPLTLALRVVGRQCRQQPLGARRGYSSSNLYQPALICVIQPLTAVVSRFVEQ